MTAPTILALLLIIPAAAAWNITLLATWEQPADRFGRALAVGPDFLAIGSLTVGQIGIFVRNDTGWTRNGTIRDPRPLAPGETSSFGRVFAVANNTILTSDSYTGDIYWFSPAGTELNRANFGTNCADNLASGSRWYVVCLDAVIAVDTDIINFTNARIVHETADYLFVAAPSDGVWGEVGVFNATTLELLGQIEPNRSITADISSGFGLALAVVGDVLAVGAPSWRDRGAVFLYGFDGELRGMLTPDEFDPITRWQQFGATLLTDSNGTLWIGAPGFSTLGYLYWYRDGRLGRVEPTPDGVSSGFGFALAAIGDGIGVGAPGVNRVYLVTGEIPPPPPVAPPIAPIAPPDSAPLPTPDQPTAEMPSEAPANASVSTPIAPEPPSPVAVGLGVGVPAAALLVGGGVCTAFVCRRRRRRKRTANSEAKTPTERAPTPPTAHSMISLFGYSGSARSGASSPNIAGIPSNTDYRAMPAQHLSRFLVPAAEVELDARVGAGNYGVVYAGRWRQTPVAIKVCPWNAGPMAEGALSSEIELMARLTPHPNVVQMMAVCLANEGATAAKRSDGAKIAPMGVWLVMEYCQGGNLADLVARRPLTDVQIARILVGVVRGLSHLHGHGIAHRDLAARNILLVETPRGEEAAGAKVGDFGLSRFSSRTSRTFGETIRGINGTGEIFGPLRWMAPEALRSISGYDEFRADVWMLGMVLYEMVARAPPHRGQPPEVVVPRIRDEGLTPPPPPTIAPVFAEFLRRCWAFDAAGRASLGELHDLLAGSGLVE